MSEGVVTLAQLTRLCDQHERLLRGVMGGELPAEWARELAAVPADSTRRALQRYKLLGAFYYQRHQQAATSTRSEEAEAAARQLLTREPVEVTLQSGRRVKVTGRSYAAMMEIAAHHNRAKLLSAELEYVGARYEAALRDAAMTGWRSWFLYRRWARRWEALYRRVASEMMRHRERIYANAMTTTGAAAALDEPAPAWWRETTAADDLSLLLALHEAGAGRYTKLGPPPETKEKRREGPDFGWHSLLTSWGIRTKVAPAAMYDADLGQKVAEMRLSAPPPLEEISEA